MKFTYLLFTPLFIFILSTGLSADKVKIKKILDSNLFEIKGGQKISLVNVDAPSISDTNSRVRSLAFTIKRYATDQLLNQSVEVEYVRSNDLLDGIRLVLLRIKYPLKTVDYNQKYLEQGFGKLVVNSVSSIEKKYWDAQQKARKKNRGVWSKYLYEPPPPIIYSGSLIWGYGSYREIDETYKEVILTSYPFRDRRGFSIRLALLYGKISQEYGEPEDGVKYFAINPYWVKNGKYFGIEPGFIFSKFPNTEYISFILLPTVRLKVGNLEKAYISLDLLTDLLYSPLSLGINFKSNSPYIKIWIGATPYIDDHRIIALKTEFRIIQRLLLKLQGIDYKYRFYPKDVYGWRVGIGYIFY